jgi:serpin B
MNLGIKSMFTAEADFSRISPIHPLMVDTFHQKTFIEINEKRTEAATVTVVEMDSGNEASIAPPPPSFFANKPFLFFIRKKTSGIILFTGVIKNMNSV